MDDDKFKQIIKTKCNICFRKDSEDDNCMLYSSKHEGIELCLGPFTDQEERTKKINEDFEREEKEADIDKAVRDVAMSRYKRNKKLFDD
jgi:hypothetical protein